MPTVLLRASEWSASNPTWLRLSRMSEPSTQPSASFSPSILRRVPADADGAVLAHGLSGATGGAADCHGITRLPPITVRSGARLAWASAATGSSSEEAPAAAAEPGWSDLTAQ